MISLLSFSLFSFFFFSPLLLFVKQSRMSTSWFEYFSWLSRPSRFPCLPARNEIRLELDQRWLLVFC